MITESVVWCSSVSGLWFLPGGVSASAKRPEVPACLSGGGVSRVLGKRAGL